MVFVGGMVLILNLLADQPAFLAMQADQLKYSRSVF